MPIPEKYATKAKKSPWIHLAGKKFGISVEPNFYEYLTAYENLESILYLNGIRRAEEMNNEIKRVLNTVGLEGVEKKKIKEFSFGMKQRLGFAQALLNAQTVLLLDEPLWAWIFTAAGW